ncbi:shikimate kinase [Metaclostridioides mangenotii]|uniref:shikimate kinase n=1 Tax=Metaclostridioides mangenotii TaxID=1540 RepID=UPI0004AF3BD5|nr:shikimate kinase [Clostridioides mangenotii]
MIDINNIRDMINSKKVFNYNIMLIGFMGAGKTTVSKHLSKMLGMNCIEMDEHLKSEQGMSISDIFEKYGEDHFRDIESKAIEDLKKKSGTIVSCGGGIALRRRNIDAMRSQGKIVLLTATSQTTLDRVKESDERPILNGNMNVEFIESLMEARKEKYLASADIHVDTNKKSVEEVCEEIVEKLIDLEKLFL